MARSFIQAGMRDDHSYGVIAREIDESKALGFVVFTRLIAGNYKMVEMVAHAVGHAILCCVDDDDARLLHIDAGAMQHHFPGCRPGDGVKR